MLFFLKKRFLTLALLTNIQGAFISIVNESSSPDLQENLLKSVLIFLFLSPSPLWLIYGCDSMGSESSIIFFSTIQSYFFSSEGKWNQTTKQGSSSARIYVTGLWFIATLLPNYSTTERLRLERETPITSKRYLW